MYKHCCEAMESAVSPASESAPSHDPDRPLVFSSKFREYGVTVHDGGSSYLVINYCPWCGAVLPKSLRDRWFSELEALGIDDPASQPIPEKYKTEAWYRGA